VCFGGAPAGAILVAGQAPLARVPRFVSIASGTFSGLAKDSPVNGTFWRWSSG
jgi:hypothetical protein